MKRIIKEVRRGSSSVKYFVYEFSFKVNIGMVRVSLFSSEYPFEYELYVFFDTRSNVYKSYSLLSDKELIYQYLRFDSDKLPTPKVRSLSRCKYFDKLGRPLSAYYRI